MSKPASSWQPGSSPVASTHISISPAHVLPSHHGFSVIAADSAVCLLVSLGFWVAFVGAAQEETRVATATNNAMYAVDMLRLDMPGAFLTVPTSHRTWL